MDDRLKAILKHALGLPFKHEILDEHKIIDDLGADSLNVVEIVMEVEAEFEIEIDDEEVEQISTVSDIKKLIKRLS